MKSSLHSEPIVRPASEVWLKAAVAGGLWASFEIIIGSFLHNLRIPFAGSLLASAGVVLMIAFYRLWPEKGLIWRAGLICALMKSISPSAVIIGPMTGIMLEALLLQGAVNVLGGNRAGFLIGGILAVGSALLHKVFSLLLLYGFNIVELYVNMYRFALKQVGIPNADPWIAFWVLVTVYIVVGMLAAYIGYTLPLDRDTHASGAQFNPTAERPYDTGTHGFSIGLLLLHLLAIPFFILLVKRAGIVISLATVTAWIGLLAMRYPGIFRRFRKPVLWYQFLLIVIFSALFWEKDCPQPLCFSYQGVVNGLEMMLRAIVVIVAFTAFGIELRNPLIREFLEKRGVNNLYPALSLAFAILPYITDRMPSAREIVKNPRHAVGQSLSQAQALLDSVR